MRWILSPLLATMVLAAQETTIRTTVPLVVAPTVVTNARGEYVNGLGASDFLLYDDDLPQKIQVDVSYFPISLVLAVQSSDIAAAALAKIQKIGSMIEPLIIGARGEAALITYDDSVRLAQAFTSDPDVLTNALRKLSAGTVRGSHMIDAATEAIRMLAERRPPNRNRVLILIGETRDRGSKTRLEDAVTVAQRENVVIYPVSYSAYLTPFTARADDLPPPSGGMNLLAVFTEISRLAKVNAAEAFSKYTGGSHLSFLKQKSLEQVITRIGEELHSQYLISFAPAGVAEEFHRIRVEVRDRPELKARTRPGYWPAR